MKPAIKAAVFLAMLFAIPLVPFLWLGESFEQSLLSALRQASTPQVVVTWAIGLLAADMFLPVPSSAVITYAGGVLGVWPGALVSWIGLSMGAIGGFGLARSFGEKLARRFTEAEDFERLTGFTKRFGPASLVLTRALPILAEACVFLVGAGGLSWSRFLPTMLISNAALALAYAACGAYFHNSDSFLIAVVASGTLPLLVALALRRWWRLDVLKSS